MNILTLCNGLYIDKIRDLLHPRYLYYRLADYRNFHQDILSHITHVIVVITLFANNFKLRLGRSMRKSFLYLKFYLYHCMPTMFPALENL